MNDNELISTILKTAEELDDERFERSFDSDPMVQRAGERIVEIIGDMVSRLSPEFQAAHPEIDYRNAKRMRNILAHHYQKVAADRVREVVRVDIPELASQLHAISMTIENPGDPSPPEIAL